MTYAYIYDAKMSELRTQNLFVPLILWNNAKILRVISLYLPDPLAFHPGNGARPRVIHGPVGAHPRVVRGRMVTGKIEPPILLPCPRMETSPVIKYKTFVRSWSQTSPAEGRGMGIYRSK